ncbi:MAG: BspA family leucine-rich repeat surface protein, partial [Alistipes sp.]|nr:BspA family leucine-rich repeat surface protein [Alistipes sp.]
TSLSTQLDLSNFNTSNVTNMDSMFLYCSVSSLDLSSFNFGNVTEFDNMFKGLGYLLASPDICKVYVSADSYTWTEDKNFGVGNYQITVK